MTATTIKEQLTQTSVGNIVYLYHIDLTPLGKNEHYYVTPHASKGIKFNGQEYSPLPIEITGISNSLEGAPGRGSLRIATGTEGAMNRLLISAIISMGDLVGAKVTVIKTFENFLDGQPQGGSNQSFLDMRFVIYKKTSFSQQGCVWTITSEMDRPMVMLPLRQCLKSDTGKGALFSPGMTRLKL